MHVTLLVLADALDDLPDLPDLFPSQAELLEKSSVELLQMQEVPSLIEGFLYDSRDNSDADEIGRKSKPAYTSAGDSRKEDGKVKSEGAKSRKKSPGKQIDASEIKKPSTNMYSILADN